MLLVVVIAVAFCVTGGWLVEVAGFGLSLEHPTANEQTIKSAAKSSALVVFSRFFLPHATESRVDAILLVELKLMRVMVGHLLLLSSAVESAQRGPTGGALILQGLQRCKEGAPVNRQTRRGWGDTGGPGSPHFIPHSTNVPALAQFLACPWSGHNSAVRVQTTLTVCRLTIQGSAPPDFANAILANDLYQVENCAEIFYGSSNR